MSYIEVMTGFKNSNTVLKKGDADSALENSNIKNIMQSDIPFIIYRRYWCPVQKWSLDLWMIHGILKQSNFVQTLVISIIFLYNL